MTKRPTEKEPLKDLDAHTSHADELAEPLPQELSPLDRLRGSVKHYEPVWDSLWEENEDSPVSKGQRQQSDDQGGSEQTS
ncbi:MAG: hypothetical protein AWU57_1230 [Marinobacter sp. T13-3]|nr:MAG: hypothetical protein AWU57_1230 [Marinobacter sp. T13-3]